jgi:hypothetical protein
MDAYTIHVLDRLTMAQDNLKQRAFAANEAEIPYLYARERLAHAEEHVLLINPPDGKNAETREAQLRSATGKERGELVDAEVAFHVARRHYETAREEARIAVALAGLQSREEHDR